MKFSTIPHRNYAFTVLSNSMLLLFFFLQAFLIYGVMAWYNVTEHFIPSLYMGYLYAGLLIAIGFVLIVSPEYYCNYKRLVNILIPSVTIPIFISLFSSIKSVIPMINPYFFDEVLMAADRSLHFGFDPWHLTHALITNKWAQHFIDINYNFWFAVMYVFTIWIILKRKDHVHRFQYLLSFFTIWTVLGIIMAMIFASGGPVYFDRLTGEGVYENLFANLRQYDLHALTLQDRLWNDYIAGETRIGSGISAMPSMHVAQSMLMYLSARDLNKKLGTLFLIFLIIIMIGSVHLGWHYALDGYVSVIITYLIYRFCGNISHWVKTLN